MRRVKAGLLICALVFGVAACSDGGSTDDTEELSLAVGDVPATVGGNVVTVPVTLTGLELVKADGDDSGDTGHLHAFIDKEPVEVGETIAKEAGIVHSADNPIKLWGMSVGEHEVTVVAGDGTHTRIGEDIEDSFTVTVEGPSVDGTAPATIEEGDDLEVELEAEGVEIVKADGDDSGDTGHFHVLVDPETAPAAGKTVPTAVENSIIHTPESTATVSGLEKGEHIIWVVLGDGNHKAFDPAVMDKLTVVVE